MINQVSETNYLGLSVHLAKMLFHGINENTSFVFARFTVIPRFCFVEKHFSYRFRTFPTRAGAVIKKKMDYVHSADLIIILVKTLLLMTERAISVIYWHVLSTRERSVSLLSMHFEDTRYERWLFFYFETLPKEISILLKG